jgi:hypothetical protein
MDNAKIVNNYMKQVAFYTEDGGDMFFRNVG